MSERRANLVDISLHDFGSGLAQILNAFIYSLAYNTTQFLTGESLEVYPEKNYDNSSRVTLFIPASSPEEVNNTIKTNKYGFTVIGNSTIPSPSYNVSWPWASVLFLASFMMLVMSIIGIIHERRTTIPDYLGYVSSLGQESQFATGVTGGVNFDGYERAREMKDQIIRYGDFGIGDEVGVVAIGDVEVVHKVRLYTTNQH